MQTCSIIGATSFTGCELIRILSRHPYVKIGFLTTRSEEPIDARRLVPTLGKTSQLKIETYHFKKVAQASDVVFLTLPHTTAMNVASDFFRLGKLVIDLSADFRFSRADVYETWYGEKHTCKRLLKDAVYGLPELNREKIRTSNLIANPGCYPTGAILGLYPLLESNLIERDSIVIDAKSGVSGAGRKLSVVTQFSELAENFSAYKVNRHQHAPEIEQALSAIAGSSVTVTFVPHLLPVNRGILSTIYVKRKSSARRSQVLKAFEAFAKREPFVTFLGEGSFPDLRQVQFTNQCLIGVTVDRQSDRVIIITAIDNLLKGASGQAVQNMNIRMGFPETAGLSS